MYSWLAKNTDLAKKHDEFLDRIWISRTYASTLQMKANKFFRISYRYICLIIQSYAIRVVVLQCEQFSMPPVPLPLKNRWMISSWSVRNSRMCWQLSSYDCEVIVSAWQHTIVKWSVKFFGRSKRCRFTKDSLLRGPSGELAHYQLLTITYGTACAPFLASRVLKELAIYEGTKYPEASVILKRDFYVDDVLFGSNSLE